MEKNIIDKLQKRVKNIDIKKSAVEILSWLIDNVEQYIDNKETVFSLYFPIKKDNMPNMNQTFNLGSLYLEFEKEKLKNERECLKILDDIVNLIKQEIIDNKELLEKLFKRLIWYYEMIGFNMKTGPVIQEMDGYVSINNFFYEPIGLDIIVTKKYNKQLPDGTLIESDKKPEIIKKEHIPEGFVVEIEIKKWAKQNITSVF